MGKTYRQDPSSPAYLKRQRHKGYRQLEESIEDYLPDYPMKHHNRIASAKNRIANPWDDKEISEYRGQEWHRNRED